ncbi:MAG TPA: thioester domain-containing protein, partial [Candidatus Olsenella avistercoris]|nr:thioester domain-containing protein [Candidatus Olsenella avistercoris]
MRETRPARPRRRAGTARRAWAVLLALALALGQALGVAGRAGAAAASQGTMTVTRVTDIQDWPDINAPFRNFHSFEASGAGVVEATAFCGDKTMATPGAGTTFSGGYALGSPLVDYILYHGYSSTRTEGYGCTPGKFYVATQYALWLALPDKAGSHA